MSPENESFPTSHSRLEQGILHRAESEALAQSLPVYSHLTYLRRMKVRAPSDYTHPKTLKSILTQAGLIKK